MFDEKQVLPVTSGSGRDSSHPELNVQLFRRLVSEAKDYAILMLDPAGFVMTWNEGARRIKGYSQEEIVGRHFSCFYLPEDVAAHRPEKELAMALANGKYEEEGRRLRHDGTQFWASVVIAPLRDDVGKLCGFTKITRDITARKEAEQERAKTMQQLQAQAIELAKLNAELEAFAHSVSHDLRAPVRHIIGFADLLVSKNREQLNEQGRKYVDRMMMSAHRMGALIDDLLAFSHLSRTSLSAGQLDLNRMIGEVISELEPDLGKRNIIWSIGRLPDVYADAALIRIALMNLLSNAAKYTSTRSEARIEIGCLECPDGDATFFVRDNGVGFEMEYVSKLFQVFQRLHSEEFEGTGIGLATVRRVIERNGGRVWAEGIPDSGAAFYFTLPIHPKEI